MFATIRTVILVTQFHTIPSQLNSILGIQFWTCVTQFWSRIELTELQFFGRLISNRRYVLSLVKKKPDWPARDHHETPDWLTRQPESTIQSDLRTSLKLSWMHHPFYDGLLFAVTFSH